MRTSKAKNLNKNESLKVPRQIAKNETLNKKSLKKQIELFEAQQLSEQDKKIYNRRTALSLQRSYPYIFDGLCYLITNYPNQIKANDITYSLKVTFNGFKTACLGNNERQFFNDFLKELGNVMHNDERKLVIQKDNSLTFERIIDITPTLNGKKNPNLKVTEVTEIVIEFSKGLFSEVVEDKNINFIQFPPFLTANLNFCSQLLKAGNVVSSSTSAIDSRLFFEYLALHDNYETDKNGNVIAGGNILKLPLVDFVQSCYPQFIKTTILKDGTEKYSVPKSRQEELLYKLQNSIKVYKFLVTMQDMNGGRLIPIEIEGIKKEPLLDDYGRQILDKKGKVIKIDKILVNVLRPANPKIPNYDNIKNNDLKYDLMIFYLQTFKELLKSKDCLDYIISKSNVFSNIINTIIPIINDLDFTCKNYSLERINKEELEKAFAIFDKNIEEKQSELLKTKKLFLAKNTL